MGCYPAAFVVFQVLSNSPPQFSKYAGGKPHRWLGSVEDQVERGTSGTNGGITIPRDVASASEVRSCPEIIILMTIACLRILGA